MRCRGAERSRTRLPVTISAREAEERLGVSRGLIFKWKKLGLIDGVVVRTPGCSRGGVLLIYLDSLEQFLEGRGLRLEEPIA